MRRWWWIPMTADTVLRASPSPSKVLITATCFYWMTLTLSNADLKTVRTITVLTHSPRKQAYLHTHLPWSTEQKGYRMRQWRAWVTRWRLLCAAPLLGSRDKSGLGAMDNDLWKFFSVGSIDSSGELKNPKGSHSSCVLRRTSEGNQAEVGLVCHCHPFSQT